MDPLTVAVAGALPTLFLSVVSFLAKHAFDSIRESVEMLHEKVDGLRRDMGAQAIESARLEQRHHSLEQRVAHVERLLERLSEGGR